MSSGVAALHYRWQTPLQKQTCWEASALQLKGSTSKISLQRGAIKLPVFSAVSTMRRQEHKHFPGLHSTLILMVQKKDEAGIRAQRAETRPHRHLTATFKPVFSLFPQANIHLRNCDFTLREHAANPTASDPKKTPIVLQKPQLPSNLEKLNCPTGASCCSQPCPLL